MNMLWRLLHSTSSSRNDVSRFVSVVHRSSHVSRAPIEMLGKVALLYV